MMTLLLLTTTLILSTNHKYNWPTSIATLMAASLFIIPLTPLTSFFSMTPNLSLSPMSALLMFLSLWLMPLTLLASYPLLHHDNNPKPFMATALILLSLLMMAFSMNSMLKFYIAFEATLIPTMFLIVRWGVQPERVLASTYMLMYTLAASLPLLISLLMTFHQTSTLSLTLPHTNLTNSSILSLFFIIAFLVKLPMYSMHQWLPKAHVEAPVAGSMILAGVLLKLGTYGIFLMFYLHPHLNYLKHPLLAISLTGAVLTATVCIRQTDIKSLIAYASVSHMSMMLAALLSQSNLAWQGATIMLIAHGLTSSGLFASANLLYESFKTRNIMLMKALLIYAPTMTLWWLLLLTSNMATPPFINLPAEMLIITSISALNLKPYITLLMISMVATTAYTLLMYTTTTHGPPHKMINPILTNSPRSHLLLLAHLLPLLIMVVKLQTLSL